MAIIKLFRAVTYSLVILSLLLPVCGCAADEFQSFWDNFRTAVLANNKQYVINSIKFPFKVMGTLDDDSTQLIEKSGFDSFYSKILSADTGLNAKPESMSQFIERNQRVDKSWVTGDEAIVGNFRFIRIAGSWYFIAASVDD